VRPGEAPTGAHDPADRRDVALFEGARCDGRAICNSPYKPDTSASGITVPAIPIDALQKLLGLIGRQARICAYHATAARQNGASQKGARASDERRRFDVFRDAHGTNGSRRACATAVAQRMLAQ
jgi:hypothetical protein